MRVTGLAALSPQGVGRAPQLLRHDQQFGAVTGQRGRACRRRKGPTGCSDRLPQPQGQVGITYGNLLKVIAGIALRRPAETITIQIELDLILKTKANLLRQWAED